MKVSQRKGMLFVFGFIALVYLVNFVTFSLPDGSRWQSAAGGLFMVALGVFWIWAVGRHVTISLDRGRGTCRLERPRWFFDEGEVETFPLEHVRRVRVSEVTIPSHDGPASTHYEVGMEMQTGRVVALSLEDSRRSAERLAARLRAFLKEGRERLTVRRFPWLMLSLGAGFAAFGAFLILSAAVARP
jgi:hypothetical protein